MKNLWTMKFGEIEILELFEVFAVNVVVFFVLNGKFCLLMVKIVVVDKEVGVEYVVVFIINVFVMEG